MSQLPQRAAPASVPTPAAPSNQKRRRFLLAFGAGGASVATVVAAKPLAATLPQAAPVPATGQGYQETEHVRDYYATTRI